MSKKPDRQSAMLGIIKLVRDDFPFYAPESQICGDKPINFSKIGYFTTVNSGEVPNFTEIDRFAKLCKNVRRSLVRNGVVTPNELMK